MKKETLSMVKKATAFQVMAANRNKRSGMPIPVGIYFSEDEGRNQETIFKDLGYDAFIQRTTHEQIDHLITWGNIRICSGKRYQESEIKRMEREAA